MASNTSKTKKHQAKANKGLRGMAIKLKNLPLRSMTFSRPQLIAYGLLFAAIGGYLIFRSFAAAPVAGAANVFVSANGSDSGANCRRFAAAQANPDPSGVSLCASFNKAASLAQAGDIVQVMDGSYGSQIISETNSAGFAARVVFEPAGTDNSAVSVASINVQDAKNLEFDYMTAGGLYVGFNGCGGPPLDALFADNIYFDHDSFTSQHGATACTYVHGVGIFATKVIINHSNIGPFGGCPSVGEDIYIYGSSACDITGDPPVVSLNDSWSGNTRLNDGGGSSIINSSIHDIFATYEGASPQHQQCVAVWGAQNVNISGNKLWDCGGNQSVLLSYSYIPGVTTYDMTGTLENNYIANDCDNYAVPHGCDAYARLELYNTGQIAGAVVIRNNSIAGTIELGPTLNIISGGSVVIANNIASNEPDCPSNATFINNYVSVPSCSGDVRLTDSFPTIWTNYLNGASATAEATAAPDMSLTAQATQLIDAGNSSYCSAADINGTVRPQGVACDVGAYEAVPTANVWVSPTGNDSTCVRGDQTKPCATFNRAYQIAQPGDLVDVGCGGASSYTYPSQRINNAVPARTGPAYVTFKPADGCTVNIGQTTGFDGSNQPIVQLDIRASYIEFDGLQPDGSKHFVIKGVPDLVQVDPKTDTAGNIILKGFSSSRFYQGDSDNVTIENSDFGPNNQTYPLCAGGSRLAADSYHQSHNLIFKDNNVHDTVISGNCHTAGVTLGCGDGVTVDSNKFWNIDQNDIEAIYFSGWCGGPSACGTGAFSYGAVTIQNNFLGKPTQNYGAIQLGPSDPQPTCNPPLPSQGNPFHDWVIRNNSTNVSNSFGLLTLRGCSSGNCPTFSGTGLVMTGNIIGNYNLPAQMSCATSGFYPSYNLVLAGNPTCSATDTTSPAYQYVNESAVPINLHLASGSAAIDKGNAANCPTSDIDGDIRPQGRACDIGADEYTGSTAITGDLNNDGRVDISDLSVLLSKWGSNNPTCDLNHNGIVDVSDLSILLSHYGK